MDAFSSSLLDGELRFGKYPTDEEVTLLREAGYTIFIDLTEPKEITWEPYDTEGLYYTRIPIKDRGFTPYDYTLLEEMMCSLTAFVGGEHRIYVHCRGGHGRSATFAGIVLGLVTGSPIDDILEAVKQAHRSRTVMKTKMRNIGAPQSIEQFNAIFFYLSAPREYFYENYLSNFWKAPILLDGREWRTTEHYFQAKKFTGTPRAEEYSELVASQSTPGMAAVLARQQVKERKYQWQKKLFEIVNSYPDVSMRPDWEEIKEEVMYTAVMAKFTQHPKLRAQLLETGDKLLVEHTKRDSYWGDGGDGSGKNRLGAILMRVRDELRETSK